MCGYSVGYNIQKSPSYYLVPIQPTTVMFVHNMAFYSVSRRRDVDLNIHY